MAISETNLEAAWNFNETSGTTLEDATTNNNDGTINGATINQTGIIDKAIDFDGTNDNVTGFTSANFNPSGAFTFNTWVKTTANSTMFLAGKDGSSTARSYILYLEWTGSILRPLLTVWRSNVAKQAFGTSDISDGDWHMITYVNDGTDLKIYVDGSLDSGTSGDNNGGSVDTDGTTFGLCYSTRGNNLYYDGLMDASTFWVGSYKTSAEITELYNSGSGVEYPFPSDVTVSPSTLTLSTTSQTPSYFIDIMSGALGLTLDLKDVEPPSPREADTGTVGEKWLNTKYPTVDRTTPLNLIPEKSFISRRYKVGI